MKFPIILLFSLTFVHLSFAQKNNPNQNIITYFNNLPDTCFQLCDWRFSEMQSNAIKTVDVKNGFLSFRHKGQEYDAFQIALFKGVDNDFIAVSTKECEAFACFTPTSFFYKYENETWTPVDSIILPNIKSLFYSDSSNTLLMDKYKSYFNLQYRLPQNGFVVKIELDICDYLQFDYPEVTDYQYDKLINGKKNVYLEWNKASNKFQISNMTRHNKTD